MVSGKRVTASMKAEGCRPVDKVMEMFRHLLEQISDETLVVLICYGIFNAIHKGTKLPIRPKEVAEYMRKVRRNNTARCEKYGEKCKKVIKTFEKQRCMRLKYYLMRYICTEWPMPGDDEDFCAKDGKFEGGVILDRKKPKTLKQLIEAAKKYAANNPTVHGVKIGANEAMSSDDDSDSDDEWMEEDSQFIPGDVVMLNGGEVTVTQVHNAENGTEYTVRLPDRECRTSHAELTPIEPKEPEEPEEMSIEAMRAECDPVVDEFEGKLTDPQKFKVMKVLLEKMPAQYDWLRRRFARQFPNVNAAIAMAKQEIAEYGGLTVSLESKNFAQMLTFISLAIEMWEKRHAPLCSK
jgi:hypothetical protein